MCYDNDEIYFFFYHFLVYLNNEIYLINLLKRQK